MNDVFSCILNFTKVYLNIFSYFRLHVNDKKYTVVPPQRDRIDSQDLSKVSDVRALVAQVKK